MVGRGRVGSGVEVGIPEFDTLIDLSSRIAKQ